MRVAVWRVAMVASGALLWVCSALQVCAVRLTKLVARWFIRSEIKWLQIKAEAKCKPVRGANGH